MRKKNPRFVAAVEVSESGLMPPDLEEDVPLVQARVPTVIFYVDSRSGCSWLALSQISSQE